MRIGRPKQLILEAVGHLGYLTALQLTRLLFMPGSLNYVREHACELFHGEYLQRLFLPTITPHGTSPAVYCLDNRGYAFLRDLGKAPGGRFRASEQSEREWLFLRHTLACNDLLMSAQLLARDVESITLESVRTDRELKREGIETVPDAWVDFRHGRSQTCIAFELDRGTVGKKNLREKIHAYLRLIDGSYKRAFKTESVTIAWVTTAGSRRLHDLIAWTEAELSERGSRDSSELFLFAALDPATTPPKDLFLAPIFLEPFTGSLSSLLPDVDGS